MRAPLLVFVAALLLALVVPAGAGAHAERATFFPDPAKGSRPKHRSSGPARVVCKPNSRKLVKRSWAGKGRKAVKRRAHILKLLKRCRYQNIQAAFDAAKTNDRVLIMPGTYREKPSRRIPVADPKCEGDGYWESSGDQHQADGRVPTYKHQVDCPNSRNLIAVVGDSIEDDDRECDQKCNLQMQGLGRKPKDVLVVGDRLKQDVIRADRADGFRLVNLTVEQGGYNDINVVETNGFSLDHLIARYAKNYGILS